MKIYFLSSQPCMLSLNGVFYGVTDKFQRFADICLSDHIFAKFTNDTKEGKIVSLEKGAGFMQGIFLEYGITVDDDADGVRNGGFGSTGK